MTPDTHKIITQQTISEGKRLRAEQFRRQPTPAEQTLWNSLRAGRQNSLHFRRQQNIDGFIADFYCHHAALVVEVDGPIHAAQADYDTERTQIFQARGLAVLRFSNDEIEQHLPTVLLRIRAEAKKRLPPPVSDSPTM